MKVALFYTCANKEYNQSGTPMGLAYLAGALSSRLGVDDIEISVDEHHLIQSKPDFVGISSYSGTYTRSIAIAKKIKQALDVPVILGGTHISVLPQNLHPIFDAGVIGEGEGTIVDLVKLYRDNQWHDANLAEIPGIVFWRDGQCHLTLPRAMEMELDQLPKPKRDILQPYWPSRGQRIQWPQVLFTARGCPYRCMFCIHSSARQKIRYHSPERVIEEIYEILERFPEQKSISIFDDLFAIHKRRLEQVVKLIRSEKLHQRVSFISHAKSSCFDEDIARLLKLMNSSMVIFGFESGSDRIIKYLKGRESSAEKNQRAIDICRKYNLNVGGYFIIGSPIETYRELARTYWFIRANDPPIRTSGAFFLTPLPGTVYWEEALQAGRVTNEMEDWSILDFTDMEKWRQQLFANQHYTFEQLDFANQKFEELRQINYRLPLLDMWDRIKLHYRQELYQQVTRLLPERARVLEIAADVDHLGQYLGEYHPEHTWELESRLHGDPASPGGNPEVVFLNHVLEWERSPLQYLEQFAGAHTLLVAVNNVGYASHLLHLLQGDFSSWKIALQGHFQIFSQATLAKLLQQAGFETVSAIPLEGQLQGLLQPLRQVIPLLQTEIPIPQEALDNLGVFGFLMVARKPAPMISSVLTAESLPVTP